MKLFLTAFFLISSAVLIQAYLNESVNNVKQWRAECQRRTGVSQVSLNKLHNHEPIQDPKLGENAFCMLKKIGVMNEAGVVSVDKIRNRLVNERGNVTEAEKLLENCVLQKNVPSSPENVAHGILSCLLYNKKPTDL